MLNLDSREKVIMLKDGSKTKIVQGSTSGTERTRKRLLKQQTKKKSEAVSKKQASAQFT